MITRLWLRNFQKWKKLEIELDPHVTTLVAPSDFGKSSIIRALKWIAFNRPLGDSFIRWGTSFCRAGIESADVKIEKRRKGRSTTYRIGGKELKAVGQGVPDLVSKSLNVGTDNFQFQHDSVFWFSLSPAQTTKELNRIVDLSEIDRALSLIKSKTMKTKTQMEYVRQQRDKIKKQKQELQWVPKMHEALKELKELNQELEEISEDCEYLSEVIEEVRECEEFIESRTTFIKEGTSLLDSTDVLFSMDEEVGELEELVQDIERSEKRKASSAEAHERMHNKLKKKMKGRCPLCQRK